VGDGWFAGGVRGGRCVVAPGERSTATMHDGRGTADEVIGDGRAAGWKLMARLVIDDADEWTRRTRARTGGLATAAGRAGGG
jgi:hypothetical protein